MLIVGAEECSFLAQASTLSARKSVSFEVIPVGSCSGHCKLHVNVVLGLHWYNPSGLQMMVEFVQILVGTV